MLTVWRSSGIFSWIKSVKETKQTDGAKAPSHPGTSTEATAQLSPLDVDLHSTKFSRNPNGTQNKEGLVTVYGEVSISA